MYHTASFNCHGDSSGSTLCNDFLRPRLHKEDLKHQRILWHANHNRPYTPIFKNKPLNLCNATHGDPLRRVTMDWPKITRSACRIPQLQFSNSPLTFKMHTHQALRPSAPLAEPSILSIIKEKQKEGIAFFAEPSLPLSWVKILSTPIFCHVKMQNGNWRSGTPASSSASDSI